MKERAALKASSQAQRMREDQNCRWLFERRNEKRDNNPAKLLEMESRVQLRKLSKAYADELSAQIADNNRFNAEKASAQKKTEMTHDAAEKYQFFNQQDYHHESRRMKPPSNSDHHRFDLLNHCPKPLLAPSPRRRAQVVEDLAKLCPLNKPGTDCSCHECDPEASLRRRCEQQSPPTPL
ncbi:hypothetical protein BC830DRAFT_130649 [Chytriomyces sp. MP71]|nr:hypothetical protein BC830DRAFT_130649 [Chytriomyces sp. MP71]